MSGWQSLFLGDEQLRALSEDKTTASTPSPKIDKVAACTPLNNSCQCNAADLGRACVWCPATSNCLPRGEILHVSTCTSSEDALKRVAQDCTGDSADASLALDSIAAGLPVRLGSTRVSTNGITDSTDGDEQLLEDGLTAHIDLLSLFSIDRITIRVSRVGDDVVDWAKAIKITTTPPVLSTATVARKYICDSGTTVPGSFGMGPVVECSLDVSHASVSAIQIKFPFENRQPVDDSMRLRQVLAIPPPVYAVDGMWGLISPWDECSNMCGVGNQSRSRHCDNPMPQYGGSACSGPASFHRACKDTTNCPTDWAVVATIGWWQLVLLLVLITTTIRGWLEQKRRMKNNEFAEELIDEVFDGHAHQDHDYREDDYLDPYNSDSRFDSGDQRHRPWRGSSFGDGEDKTITV